MVGSAFFAVWLGEEQCAFSRKGQIFGDGNVERDYSGPEGSSNLRGRSRCPRIVRRITRIPLASS